MNWLNRNEEIVSVIMGAIVIIVLGALIVNYFKEIEGESGLSTDKKERSVQEFEAMTKKHGCELGVREIEYHTDGSVKKVVCTVRGE